MAKRSSTALWAPPRTCGGCRGSGRKRMQVCVVGAGALGSTIGGTLAAGGCEVWLIDSYQAHVDAINHSGLRMVEEESERVVTANARTSAGIPPVDLVIVLVKSFHTRDAV